MSIDFERLDTLDKRLIRELDRNCRQSFNALSRTLKVPAETLRYRLNSLLEQKIIYSFFTVIDAGKLNCSIHKVLIKLRNVDEVKYEKIVRYLVNNGKVNWVARMDGLYDLCFTIWVSNISELSEFIDSLKSQFFQFLSKVTFAVNVDVEFLPREFTKGGKTRSLQLLEKEARYTTPKVSYGIDEIDLQIMKTLSLSPRVNATDIAKHVGITSETVAYRIKKLEAERIITGYRLSLNPAITYNYNYYLLVFLNSVSENKIKDFVGYCRRSVSVNYIIKALGEWDYELNIEVDSVKDFRNLMMEMTREYSEIIRDYISIPVSELHKFTIMPQGVNL